MSAEDVSSEYYAKLLRVAEDYVPRFDAIQHFRPTTGELKPTPSSQPLEGSVHGDGQATLFNQRGKVEADVVNFDAFDAIPAPDLARKAIALVEAYLVLDDTALAALPQSEALASSHMGSRKHFRAYLDCKLAQQTGRKLPQAPNPPRR